jgi:hypothetical protein
MKPPQTTLRIFSPRIGRHAGMYVQYFVACMGALVLFNSWCLTSSGDALALAHSQ